MSGSPPIQQPIQLGIHNKPITRQEYRNRQALLNQVNNFWVKGVLEKSLYNQVMIELGLEERPDAITNHWSAIIETDDSPQPLPDGTNIIYIFDQIGIGRTLLILGEPGSGKTTTLLELTRDLIDRAKQNSNLLIPAFLNLSAWTNKQQKIANWLVEELYTRYDIPKEIGQVWVTQQKLLPLLDGLDEVKAEYRDDCIAALNQFKQEYYGAELVVCSRIKDYEALSSRLNFQSAVYIRLLTLEQICDYLDNVGGDLRGLRALMEEDTVLQELAQSPLMLNIMTLAYQGVAVEDLPKTEIAEERRKQLFDDYIEKMFHRPNRSKGKQIYSKYKTIRWLNWLAQRMVQESQTIFLIETIQPYLWLQNIQDKLVYGFILGLNLGLLSFIFLYLLDITVFGFIGIPLFLILGMTKGNQVQIQPIELLQWSWKKGLHDWYAFINKSKIYSSSFFMISTAKFYLESNSYNQILRIFIALSGGLISAIALTIFMTISVGTWRFLMAGFQIKNTANTTVPNQGIKKSFKNAIFTTLIGCLITVVICLPLIGLTELLHIKPESLTGLGILKLGLSVGLMVGTMRGFLCIIQHFILRLILYFNNYIPWNYAHFLDYAAERIFLQKVGGGYIFIHRMLMEHFAQIERER
ncbi:MAG: NACHT domain-containing protein [Coleofasciculus sp. C1-SOL-03]|uniref:NACHT domain-containing protein n=1 Tax=Coleofasciculus sp. C1-SOL-03 TaxID=3069522 RepID=UPI00330212C2